MYVKTTSISSFTRMTQCAIWALAYLKISFLLLSGIKDYNHSSRFECGQRNLWVCLLYEISFFSFWDSRDLDTFKVCNSWIVGHIATWGQVAKHLLLSSETQSKRELAFMNKIMEVTKLTVSPRTWATYRVCRSG